MTLKTEREKYTGTQASQYDARRQHLPPWQQEQDAVQQLVEHGPVLDVPIGTGRYLPIYQAKGLDYVGCDISADMIHQAEKRYDQNLKFKLGDITQLPFNSKEFATAVCTRLLNWLNPSEMQKAVRELRRVAHTVVLSIRVGEGEQQLKTYTHKAGDLLDALDGYWITDDIHLRDEGPAGNYHMVRFRKPEWHDVEAQFAHQPVTLQTLADEWAERYGLQPQAMQNLPVRCEYWGNDELGNAIDKMAEREPRLTREGSPHVATEPYTHSAPITVLNFSEGRLGMVDGRHRADKWRNRPGRYPVFVVDCCA